MNSRQRLGKYDILETLGRGAMGVVYKGFDPGIDRTVAIKTVLKELIEDDDRAGMALARFRNEARAAGRLSHPGIVAVYDYGESDAVTYIAMEYVQGNSLREYFNRGTRFSEPDIVSIMAQLLEALQHAHEAGVWHRDIKPANLIIMGNGRLKIADFGIARIETSQLTQTGMVMGSPGYMAPEQYSGGAVDFRADLFAAGVVMHQLLTGVRLFTGSAEQVAYKICHQEAPPPSVVDPGKGWERYDAVVARALAKDPAQRYASARTFRDAIVDVYAAPASAAISEETIIAAPTMPAAVFEPSNPSARTGDRAASAPAMAIPPPLPPPPIGAVPGATPVPAAATTPAARKWPVLVGALIAVVIGALLGGWWVQRARVPSTTPAPLAGVRPAPEAEPVVAPRPPSAAAARKASPPPVEAAAPPARAAVATPATPSKPALQEPEPASEQKKTPRKSEATATTSPKPPAPRPVEPKPTATAPKSLAPSPVGHDTATAPAATEKPKPAKPAPVAVAPPAAPVAPPAPAQPEPRAEPQPAAPPEPSIWRDQGITMKVASRVQFNRRLWSYGIQVETVAGIVTLKGTVATQAEFAEAEKLAAGVSGVLGVRNEIKISP